MTEAADVENELSSEGGSSQSMDTSDEGGEDAQEDEASQVARAKAFAAALKSTGTSCGDSPPPT